MVGLAEETDCEQNTLILSLLLLLFGGGEEHVVEDQAVAGGVREEVEVGGRVVDQMLVVLGIVTRIERPSAFAILAVNVACLIEKGAFPHNGHCGFDELLAEGRCLSHEAWNYL